MAYGIKYTCTFTDLYDRTILLYIRERDYSGSPSSIVLGGTPILYTKQTQETEFYSRINGSTLEIEILCTSVGQYDEFFGGDSRTYQVEMQIDSTTFFVGYIEPGHTDRDVQNFYLMHIVATDGLGYLKEIEFKNGDDYFTGYLSLYYILWYAISKIDPTPVFRDASDIYYAEHDTNYSPLTQTYVHSSWLRESRTKAKSCWVVVEEILRVFLCRLQHSNGRWEITPCDLAGDYTFRVMTGSSGTISGTTPLSPEIAITGASTISANRNVYINRTQHLYLMQSYKQITAIQKYGRTNNLLQPDTMADFTRIIPYGVDYTISHSFYVSPDELASRYGALNYYSHEEILTIKYLGGEANYTSYIEYTLGDLDGNPIQVELDIAVKEIAFAVPLGTIVLIQNGGDPDQYLHADGQWSTALESTYYGWEPTNVKLLSENIPNKGTLLIRFSLWVNNASLAVDYHRAMATIDIGNSSVSLQHFGDEIAESLRYTNYGDTANTYIPPDITFTLGDVIQTPPNTHLIFANALYYLDGSDYIPTLNGHWTCDRISGSWGLLYLVTQRILAQMATPLYKLTGQCMAHWWPYSQPTTLSRTFLISDTEYDVKRSVWNATLYEIARDDEHILLESGDDLLLEDGTSLMNKE